MDIQIEKETWKKLLSCRRLNDIKKNEIDKKECVSDPRNPFQRDCDRITFSYPFRRLQDKTQVIPLPVIDFVHTRLTHTLEVSTVGRSLGKLLENFLLERNIIEYKDIGNIPAILTAACLAHDIGNPPFGHSGEDSISEYFNENKGFDYIHNIYSNSDGNYYILKDIESQCKITDLQKFEGNAMGFRLLTNHENLNLTCATLATFTKYPRQSFIEGEDNDVRWSKRASQKKYGFFQTEIEEFKIIANEIGLKELNDHSTGNYAWARHPLAFLMEAADDICYRVIDLEDGFRIGRIPFYEAEEPMLSIAKMDPEFRVDYYVDLSEKHKFSYLRAISINVLILKTFEAFKDNYDKILMYEFDNDLIKSVDPEIVSAINLIKEIVKKYIYKWQEVLLVESAGFEVLGGLISEFIEASNICLNCNDDRKSKKALKILDLLPDDYKHKDDDEPYLRYLKIAFYVSGMTDSYAINIFQRIKGIKT